MPEKFFDVDFLAANSSARVLISGIESKSILAFNTNDLSFSGSNDFTSLFDTSKLEGVATLLDKIKAISPNAAGESLNGLSLRTTQNSLYSWTGSARPPINLQLVFLATRTTDDVRKPAVSIMRSVFPIGNEFEGTTTLLPPLGYQARADAKSAAGTVAIKVGSWFQATGLVVRSADFTFSKEVTRRGTPLFATGSMTLEPYRVITYNEFKSWFVGV